MPARIRPVLHRWFEEIRRRRNANMSKKGLLKDAVEGEESSGRPLSLHDRESESTSSLHESTVPSKAAMPVVEEKSDAAVVLPRPSVSDKTYKESKEHKHDPEICGKRDVKGGGEEEDEEEKENKVVEKAVVVEEVVAAHEEDHHDQETEEDEEEEDDEPDTYICRGSPSFRVYCVHSTDDEEEEEISKKGSRHKNSPSTGDSVESNSSEEQEIRRTKKNKGNKGRRLKRAIRKSGPAVKNLLHVATCYHPACSGQDRAHLLEEKAQAA